VRNNMCLPEEDPARVPLFFTTLASPIIYFNSFLLYLTSGGAREVDYWGHSPLLGLWGAMIGLSLIFNIYYLCYSIINGLQKEPIYRLIFYVTAYELLLVSTYFTYNSWGQGIMKFVVGITGLFCLVFVTIQAAKFFFPRKVKES